MKNLHFLLFGSMMALVHVALADTSTRDKTPTLQFRTIPIEGSPITGHKVTPYRFYDRMIITVWDPIQCGQKPVNPAFSIRDEKILLSYSLSPTQSAAESCTLISEFIVSDLPNRDLEVHFAGGPEPYVIAKLRKCPNYSPKSDDIWECLAPISGK